MHRQVYFWRSVPFFRIILPFIAGIIIQFYYPFPIVSLLMVAATAVLTWFLSFFIPPTIHYSFRWIRGISIYFLLTAVGAMVTLQQDIRQQENWLGHNYKDSMPLLLTIQELLTEKEKTYKAEATVEAAFINNQWQTVSGRVIVYFKRDSTKPNLTYGSQLVVKKPLQTITNSGNPGAFDYNRYCAFQDIHHQLYLTNNEYEIYDKKEINRIRELLIEVRTGVIDILKRNIKGEREAGVAEALLIGYRGDLDKDLVQAYSNTGVVHIIAISGLHLGMIYGGLILFFKLFKKRRWAYIVKPFFILIVIWLFTLIAGAAPSILRSAVMFSFILVGEIISRKTNIYNTLCLSAMVMLIYNPYFLWDVGFQLSYLAVVSIVAFQQPIYNWLYFKNKILDFFWKLLAISIAAQILTAPIIFYYFHQFPLLFMVTNLVAVPLSSLILGGELLIILSAFIPPAALFIGKITEALLYGMNSFIERINALPYVVYDGINNSVSQTMLLYVLIIALSVWLLHKSRPAFYISLASLIAFISLTSTTRIQTQQQQKIIVYNIPQHNAIDFVAGNDFHFVGDTSLLANPFLQNFHLRPSRITNQVVTTDALQNLYYSYPFLQFNNKRILLIDKPLKFNSNEKIDLDLVVVSHNPKLFITELTKAFNVKQFVFDASNPLWKISKWKKDCDSLHLPHYSTRERGAFVMSL